MKANHHDMLSTNLIVGYLNVVEEGGDDFIHVLLVPNILGQLLIHCFPHHSSDTLA